MLDFPIVRRHVLGLFVVSAKCRKSRQVALEHIGALQATDCRFFVSN